MRLARLVRLVVTRPRAQAEHWVARLQALGIDAAVLPLIDIGPPADPAAVQAAWLTLPGKALVVFVSPNAAERFMAARPQGVVWPAGVLAGATGPGTAAALRDAGVPAAALVVPADDAPAFDSEALWALLRGRPWIAQRVLVVRGEEGRDWLADTLRGLGADVGFVNAYRRLAPQPDAAGVALLQAALAAPAAHCWLFSSSQAVAHLRALAPRADWRAALALATHPRIAQTVRAAGFGHTRECAPTLAAVVQALHAVAAWGGATPVVDR